MGRKHVSRPYKVTDQGDMSANITSESTSVEQFDFLSYRLTWGGGAGVDGSFFIEVSDDEGEDAAKNWIELDFGQTLPVVTDTGDDYILIKDVHFKYARVKYSRVAGTGSIDITLKAGTKGA